MKKLLSILFITLFSLTGYSQHHSLLGNMISQSYVPTPTVTDTSSLYDNLIFWYDLQETTVTAVEDSSINNNHGVNNNVQVDFPGVGDITKSYYFDGGLDWLSAGDPSPLVSTDSFSISTWIKVKDLLTDNSIVVAWEDSINIANEDAVLNLWWDVAAATSGRSNTISIYMDDESPDAKFEGSTNAIADTNWHHIVVTVKDEIRLYIDGAEDAQSPVAITNPSVDLSVAEMRIGMHENINRELTGNIAQAVIWDKVLTNAEVDSMYLSGSGRTYNSLFTGGTTPTTPEPEPVATSDTISPTYTVDYYVDATDGNDSNDGLTPSTAWQTLTKVNTTTFSAGDVVGFQCGESWEGTLDPNQDGISGSPVTYAAYGSGARPKIYGSEEITGWTVHSGNVYKATFATPINQLYVDDIRIKLARSPNTGYYLATSVTNDSTFTSTSLDGTIDYTGATAVVRSSRYTMFAKVIESSSSQTITLSDRPSYNVDLNEGFFVCDHLDFLDEAGEWYYDSSTNTVYLWTPDGDSPTNYTVRGATTDYNVDMYNADYITLKHLDLRHAAITGINADLSYYLIVDSCHIIGADLMGVYGSTSTDNMAVKNSYIYQANGNGLRIYGTNNLITNNKIDEVGLLQNINKKTHESSDNFGTGIYSRDDDQIFTNNTITNCGYIAINWKGERSKINYNYVDGACLVLDDGGGIYTYNSSSDFLQAGSANSEVRYNIVLNVTGNKEGYPVTYNAGSGIYMDDKTHDVDISHNVVSGCTYGIFLHYAGRITVDSNLVVNSFVNLLAGGEEANSNFEYNTVYAFDRPGDVSWWTNGHQRMTKNDAASPIYDYNSYYHPYATDSIFSNYYDFAEWKTATGQDANSTINTTSLGTGETPVLYYNKTKTQQTYTVSGTDLDGNPVTEITLEPFTGQVIIE